jgi:hypothetical protein
MIQLVDCPRIGDALRVLPDESVIADHDLVLVFRTAERITWYVPGLEQVLQAAEDMVSYRDFDKPLLNTWQNVRIESVIS